MHKASHRKCWKQGSDYRKVRPLWAIRYRSSGWLRWVYYYKRKLVY
jgi:hypothetical protein